jgi:hypothetical protein
VRALSDKLVDRIRAGAIAFDDLALRDSLDKHCHKEQVASTGCRCTPEALEMTASREFVA